MCGIFAYAGDKDAGQLIIEGLKRLEYRGYDSWGVALLERDRISVYKKVGPIGNVAQLKNLPKANMGIGHTRWATHGGVTETNAHPHFSTDKTFVVAQNGIVENYQELKTKLKKEGYEFQSQTDTEVIVRLIESKRKQVHNLKEAVKKAFLTLKGRNTIVVLSQENGQMIAIRHGSPLVVGIKGKELFLASDTLSFANITNEVIFVNDYELVDYQNGELGFYDLKRNKRLSKKPVFLTEKEVSIDKEGHDSFYHKEVMEQPQTIKTAVLYTEAELSPLLRAIESARHVYTLGAGSASFAAGQGAYYLRQFNHLPVVELKAYEIQSYAGVFETGDILIAVSQSGETADVLEAIKVAKSKGVRIASIVNMVGSTLSRESEFPYLTRSGPEISVVSTKAFTAQVSWFLLLSYALKNKTRELKTIFDLASQSITRYAKPSFLKKVEQLAKVLVKKEHVYILGKNDNYYIAFEAAMKIKEISYIHAEAFSAGELKHGVIALVSKGTPVMGIMPAKDAEDTLSALAEVKARGAYVVGIGPVNNELFDFWLPSEKTELIQPIANILPVQLLGYYLAKIKKISPDKPRNLAKSVTVK